MNTLCTAFELEPFVDDHITQQFQRSPWTTLTSMKLLAAMSSLSSSLDVHPIVNINLALPADVFLFQVLPLICEAMAILDLTEGNLFSYDGDSSFRSHRVAYREKLWDERALVVNPHTLLSVDEDENEVIMQIIQQNRITHLFFENSRNGLTDKDVTSRVNITLPNNFICGCNWLRYVNLSAFAAPDVFLQSIPHYFFSRCEVLERVDNFESISGVLSIGESFFYQCARLSCVDLSPLYRISAVPSFFLSGCEGLTALDVTPLGNVHTVNELFLSRCLGLTELDLSHTLRTVTSVGAGFCSGCTSLHTLRLPDSMSLQKLEIFFVAACYSLTSLDLSWLRNVTHIERHFLERCSSLTALDVGPLGNVRVIDDFFMNDCVSLQNVRWHPIRCVKYVNPRNILNGCSALIQRPIFPYLEDV
eukprot:PhM_4_TR18509/c0_g1_i1/m.56611